MASDSKTDAFIDLDHSKNLTTFLSSGNNQQIKALAHEDLFSFVTERQKARVTADLCAPGVSKNVQLISFLNYQSRESAFFTTITIASVELLLLVPSIAFPILNWTILATLATEVTVNLYVAKNADTVRGRHQAALDAGINSVELLFILAFINFRSLKFSKNQSESLIQNPERLRPLTSGSGTFPFLAKTPISEETFFDTTNSMTVWRIVVSSDLLMRSDIKTWFLDEQFLLFTAESNKAKHLIISAHGEYLPISGIVKVSKNTELVVLGPHGWQLLDPQTEKIAKRLVLPYGIINESGATPTQTAFYPSLFSSSANTHIHSHRTSLKLLAETSVPGHIRNYTLAKYQKFGIGEESYLDIARIIHNSRHPFPNIYKIGISPVDILTVCNRRGKLLPSLKDVFESLEKNEIHYDRITLEFCRSKIPLSANNPAPKYNPIHL